MPTKCILNNKGIFDNKGQGKILPPNPMDFLRKTECDNIRYISIHTPNRVNGKGNGVSKAKIWKGKYDKKLEFPVGAGRGFQSKNSLVFLCKGYG